MQPVVRFASWTGISQEKPAGTAVKYRTQSYNHRLGARTVVEPGVCMFHVIGFKSPGAINGHLGSAVYLELESLRFNFLRSLQYLLQNLQD